MSLKKNKKNSNMYPWVDAMHSHIGGECPHKCSYCYVNNPISGRPAKFSGPIKMLEGELNVNYGEGKTIFIDHNNDLFAVGVPTYMILNVLDHCNKYPNNTFVFQTKNPKRFLDFGVVPKNSILGCTIETNRDIPKEISVAPCPKERFEAMKELRKTLNQRIFITIEPIMDFDVEELASWIVEIKPEFVNIGADSKKHNLPEPSAKKILDLVAAIGKAKIEIREKHNLGRILDAEKNS